MLALAGYSSSLPVAPILASVRDQALILCHCSLLCCVCRFLLSDCFLLCFVVPRRVCSVTVCCSIPPAPHAPHLRSISSLCRKLSSQCWRLRSRRDSLRWDPKRRQRSSGERRMTCSKANGQARTADQISKMSRSGREGASREQERTSNISLLRVLPPSELAPSTSKVGIMLKLPQRSIAAAATRIFFRSSSYSSLHRKFQLAS